MFRAEVGIGCGGVIGVQTCSLRIFQWNYKKKGLYLFCAGKVRYQKKTGMFLFLSEKKSFSNELVNRIAVNNFNSDNWEATLATERKRVV